MNSTWATGDFNGDGEFDSSDFVVAFADGGYEKGPKPAATAVPETVLPDIRCHRIPCDLVHLPSGRA